MIVIESAHSFGVCIFVFRVLPKLDLARAILMMNAVCIMPGLLKLLLSKNRVSVFKRLIIFIIDFIAVLMQCSVFGIVFASKFMFNSEDSPGTDSPFPDSSATSAENIFESGARLARHLSKNKMDVSQRLLERAALS